MPQLIEPTYTLSDAFIAYAEEFQAAGDLRYVEALVDIRAYIARMLTERDPAQLKPGRVPQKIFWLVEAEHILGVIRLRSELNDFLRQIGGHIGYDIRPSERRKGYGSLMLGLLLPIARQHGLSQVLITCDVTNIASARIIEKHGGQFQHSMTIDGYDQPIAHYWIELSKQPLNEPERC